MCCNVMFRNCAVLSFYLRLSLLPCSRCWRTMEYTVLFVAHSACRASRHSRRSSGWLRMSLKFSALPYVVRRDGLSSTAIELSSGWHYGSMKKLTVQLLHAPPFSQLFYPIGTLCQARIPIFLRAATISNPHYLHPLSWCAGLPIVTSANVNAICINTILLKDREGNHHRSIDDANVN